MPYVKLDCGILDSSLWFQKTEREMFITALLMAKPRELRQKIQPLRVDAIEPDDSWIIPPGWYGFVEAAGSGIANRCGIDKAEGIAALRALCSPDPESRSPEWNGRRMARVPGGYLILNYNRYREKDHTAAERARRYRERRRKRAAQQAGQPSRHAVKTSRHAVTSCNVTEAEAEAKAEAKANNPPPTSEGCAHAREEQSEQHASHESATRPGVVEVMPDYGPSFEKTTVMLDSTAETELPPWADVESPPGQEGATAERDSPETLRSGPRVQPHPRCHGPDAQAILDRLLSYPELSSVLADPVEIANWHAARLGMASANRRTVARVLECIDLVAEASRDSRQDGPLRPGSEVAKHLRSLVSLQPHEYSEAKRKAAERAEVQKPKRKRKRPKPPSEPKGDPISKTQVDNFLADFAGSMALESKGGKRRKGKPKRAKVEAVEDEPMWCNRCKVATHSTGDKACELYWKELEAEDG